MQTLYAWIIVAVAGLGVLGSVFVLSRLLPWPLPRSLVRCLAAAWLLLPSPLPGYPGHYAPAFVVLLFEALFQPDGHPEQAAAILAAATAVLLVLFGVLFVLRRRRNLPAPQ